MGNSDERDMVQCMVLGARSPRRSIDLVKVQNGVVPGYYVPSRSGIERQASQQGGTLLRVPDEKTLPEGKMGTDC